MTTHHPYCLITADLGKFVGKKQNSWNVRNALMKDNGANELSGVERTVASRMQKQRLFLQASGFQGVF